MSIDPLKKLLSSYGKSHGINDLTLDEDGYSCLSAKENEQIVIHVKYDAEKNEVTLLAEIGKVNANQKHLIYPILLQANDSFEETKGATIAKAAGEDTITIAKKVFVDHLDTANFETFMENFRAVTLKWSDQLLRLSRGEMVARTDADSESSSDAMMAATTVPTPLHHGMRA